MRPKYFLQTNLFHWSILLRFIMIIGAEGLEGHFLLVLICFWMVFDTFLCLTAVWYIFGSFLKKTGVQIFRSTQIIIENVKDLSKILATRHKEIGTQSKYSCLVCVCLYLSCSCCCPHLVPSPSLLHHCQSVLHCLLRCCRVGRGDTPR